MLCGTNWINFSTILFICVKITRKKKFNKKRKIIESCELFSGHFWQIIKYRSINDIFFVLLCLYGVIFFISTRRFNLFHYWNDTTLILSSITLVCIHRSLNIAFINSMEGSLSVLFVVQHVLHMYSLKERNSFEFKIPPTQTITWSIFYRKFN